MRRRPSRRRALLLLGVAVLAAAVGIVFGAANFLPRLELATIDSRFDLRGAEAPRRDIVIVGIDDKALQANPKDAFPLDRKRHAKVVRNLTRAGAKVIAYDLQFTQPTSLESDNALVLAVRASRRVVLGTGEIPASPKVKTLTFGGAEGLKYSRGTVATVNFRSDADGRIRRMPYEVAYLPGFALTAAEKMAGHALPKPSGGSAWIDFAGPGGTYPQLSFADVESGHFDPAAVRGKLVIVGPTSPSLQDHHATSTSSAMSGPELEANAAATALDGFPLHQHDSWVNWLLAVALGVVAPLVALALRPAIGLAAGLVAVVAYVVGVQIVFDHGAILHALPPLAAAFTGIAGTAIVANPVGAPWFERFVSRVGGAGRTRRLRTLLLLTAAFAVVAGVSLAAATHLLRRAELSTVDTRFKIRGQQPAPTGVTLVPVDDETLNLLNRQRWPYNRSIHARVLRNLTRAGAKVVAFDIVFREPNPADPKGDNAFTEAIHDAPHVVLSTTSVAGGETELLSWGKGLAYSRAVPGITRIVNDVDGRIRHMEFVSEGLNTFPIAAARIAKPSLRLPDGNTAWIDYHGPPQSVRSISYAEVYRNEFPASAVRGRVVVIGASAASLQDQHFTSTSGSVLAAGPEIQAEEIATALEGFPLRSGPWWLNALLVLVLGTLAPLAAIRLRVSLALGVGVLGIVGLLVGAQLAFNGGTIVVVAYPFIAGLLALLATGGIHGVTVAFEKEQARDAFARFVPETVVDQVLADAGDGVRLGGVRSEATVMFSDLRGFTSFSETLEPERVIDALNRYLTEMSEAILNHGGTLVAYMGDGIMAVFGAPLRQDDHADRALEAAREMLDRLQGFNAWLREQQLHDGFKMGIGLNSGPVMSGNVGSERRLEYTALGDTTNTAARLEGMTKGTPHQLYLADTTHQALTRPADDLEAVGEAEVRGRKAKVRLWSLREGPAPAAPEEAAAPETVET